MSIDRLNYYNDFELNYIDLYDIKNMSMNKFKKDLNMLNKKYYK